MEEEGRLEVLFIQVFFLFFLTGLQSHTTIIGHGGGGGGPAASGYSFSVPWAVGEVN